MAFSKIVGFDVSPRIPISSIAVRMLPSLSMSREMSSCQALCLCSRKSCLMRLSATKVPPHRAKRLLHVHVLGGLDLCGELFLTEDAQRGRRHPLRGKPEVLQDFAART